MSEEKRGVGDELAKLIPDWAVQFGEGCGCKDMQKKMNIWGPDGCEKRRSTIVAHLLGQDEHLIPILKSMPMSLKKIGVERMLTVAIRNARNPS